MSDEQVQLTDDDIALISKLTGAVFSSGMTFTLPSNTKITGDQMNKLIKSLENEEDA